MRSLNIAVVNCRSVRRKAAVLSAFIESKKPDIILGTESWLEQDINSAEIFPSNFNIFRKDRNSNGGGVFVAINKKVPCFERKDLVDEENEVVWCEASLSGQTILIGAFYRPPGENINPINRLGESLFKINSCTRSPHVILGGDFNVPGLTWTADDDVTSPKGNLQKSLLNLIDDNHLTQMVTFPTRHHQNGTENTLDLVLTTHPSLMKEVKPVAGLSDHCTVKAKFSTITNLPKKPPRKISLWKSVVPDDFKTKTQELRTDYFKRHPELKSVEENWSWFRDTLKSIVSDTVPTKTVKDNIRKPWFTRKLKRLCSKKEKAYIKAKRSKSHQDWINFIQIRKLANKSIRSAHRQYVKDLTDNASVKNFWRYIRSTRTDNVGIQPLKVNDQLFTKDQDKACALSRQFESVFNRQSQSPNLIMPGNPFPEMPPIVIDTEGVRKLLRNIDTSKAIGPDQIPNQALKLAADEVAPVLQHLFQQSLDSGDLPEDWRKANITPIHKKGSQQIIALSR
nr:uncharacterized protein LOC129261189 [Lytechinus pictus]